MVTQNSVDLVESFWKEVWQTPDNINAVDRFVTEDFVVTTGGRDIVGREAFKRWISEFRTQIDDLKFDIVHTFQSGDGKFVSARFRIRGLNNGLMGFPADRRPIEFTGNAIWHVGPQGRLVHNWVERSSFELFRDLHGISHVNDPFAVARQ
ncbi:MAG TPA: ester cyclase [Paraburkholderia sp.]